MWDNESPFRFQFICRAVEGCLLKAGVVCVPRKRHVEPEDLLARWPRAMLSRQKRFAVGGPYLPSYLTRYVGPLVSLTPLIE